MTTPFLNVGVKRDVVKRLKQYGFAGDSYNDVIQKIIVYLQDKGITRDKLDEYDKDDME